MRVTLIRLASGGGAEIMLQAIDAIDERWLENIVSECKIAGYGRHTGGRIDYVRISMEMKKQEEAKS